MIKFIKNFFILTLSTGIINIIEIITNAYITQKIGTTILGSFSLITNIFNFLVTISLFGIPLAITKLASEKDALKEDSNLVTVANIGYKLCALISIIVCIITIVFKDAISKYLLPNIQDEKIIIIIALSLPFISISSCICGYFNALRKVNKPVINELLTHIIRSFVIVFLISRGNYTFMSFGLAIFLSEALSFIYIFIMYKRDLRKNYSTIDKVTNKQKTLLTKDIMRIACPISFTSFVRSGLSTLKHTLIPIRLQNYGFSYEYALSRYGIIHGIALPFILMPSIFINCFSTLLLPEYSRYYAKNDTEKIHKTTTKIFKLTMLTSLYFSFIIYTSSDLLCSVIYKNNEVAYYVKVLTPLICIMYIDVIVDNMLRGLDLQLKVMKINIIDVVTCIILIYFGVPYLGTFGYILVLYVSEYLNGLLSVNILLKKIHLDFNFKDWLIIPSLLFFISFYISNTIFKDTLSAPGLILNIIFFSICFIVLYSLVNFTKKYKV